MPKVIYNTATSFNDAGLLDEIRLTVAPVALAGGASLLPRTIRARNLTLTGVRQAGAFAELTYAVTRHPVDVDVDQR